MASSRFSLGDGVSSVSGRHRGRGLFRNKFEASRPPKIPPKTLFSSDNAKPITEVRSSGDLAGSAAAPASTTVVAADIYEDPDTLLLFKKKFPARAVVADREDVGYINYSTHLVTSYEDLKKVLDINASVSGSVSLAGSVSTSLQFAQTVSLRREHVTLIVIGKYVSHVDSIPKDPDLAVDMAQCKLLEEDPVTFVNSNGDHYVSSVQYGAIFYAEIKIYRVSSTMGETFKYNIESKLNELLKGTRFGFGTRSNYKKNELLERADMSIQITHIGVPELGFPHVSTKLNDFVDFVKSFNNVVRENIQNNRSRYPIGHTTEPYTTLLKSHAASRLHINVELSKELISDFDHILNRTRYITPTAQKIVALANKFPKTAENSQRIERLNLLYRDSLIYQNLIQTIMLKIDSAQTDLTTLQLRLTDNIDSDKTRLLASQPRSVVATDDEQNEDGATFVTRDRLKNLAHRYLMYVLKLERDVENTATNLVAEIVRKSFAENYFNTARLLNTDHFHIKTPSSGTTLRWRIYVADTTTELDTVQFNVYVQKKVLYKKIQLFSGLRNNAITAVTGVQPTDRYKVKNVRTLDGKDYNGAITITLSVIGDEALLVLNGGKAINALDPNSPEERQSAETEQKAICIEDRSLPRQSPHANTDTSSGPALVRSSSVQYAGNPSVLFGSPAKRPTQDTDERKIVAPDQAPPRLARLQSTDSAGKPPTRSNSPVSMLGKSDDTPRVNFVNDESETPRKLSGSAKR